MHEFLLRKGRDGMVRLYVRKSSQASSWLPEGDGYPIFKSLPTGQPELATPHAEHSWKRADVEETVYKWFKYMIVTPAELYRIREDWKQRFAALPPNNDINLLDDSMKPKWVV